MRAEGDSATSPNRILDSGGVLQPGSRMDSILLCHEPDLEDALVSLDLCSGCRPEQAAVHRRWLNACV